MSEDTLRDELTRIVVTFTRDSMVDHLLPVVRRETDQARADERERLADAAEKSRLFEPDDGYDKGVNAGLDYAITIARGG